jgi:hypothetical protein
MFIETRLNISLQHDGTSTHYSHEVRQWLSENYPGRWIGRGSEASLSWPARSPDLNPLDSFLWGYLKSKACASTVDTEAKFASGSEEHTMNFRTLDSSFFTQS